MIWGRCNQSPRPLASSSKVKINKSLSYDVARHRSFISSSYIMGTKEKKRRRRRILSIDLYSGGGGRLAFEWKEEKEYGSTMRTRPDIAEGSGSEKKKQIKKMDVLFSLLINLILFVRLTVCRQSNAMHLSQQLNAILPSATAAATEESSSCPAPPPPSPSVVVQKNNGTPAAITSENNGRLPLISSLHSGKLLHARSPQTQDPSVLIARRVMKK